MSRPVTLDWPLEKLQTWMLRVTTDSGWNRAGVATEEYVGLNSGELERLLRTAGVESPIERLAIYRRGYFNRLAECLADDFPALMSALGDQDFKTLC